MLIFAFKVGVGSKGRKQYLLGLMKIISFKWFSIFNIFLFEFLEPTMSNNYTNYMDIDLPFCKKNLFLKIKILFFFFIFSVPTQVLSFEVSFKMLYSRIFMFARKYPGICLRSSQLNTVVSKFLIVNKIITDTTIQNSSAARETFIQNQELTVLQFTNGLLHETNAILLNWLNSNTTVIDSTVSTETVIGIIGSYSQFLQNSGNRILEKCIYCIL